MTRFISVHARRKRHAKCVITALVLFSIMCGAIVAPLIARSIEAIAALLWIWLEEL